MKKTYIVTINYCAGLLGTSKYFENLIDAKNFIENYKKSNECGKFYCLEEISGLFKKTIKTLEIWNEE